MKNNIADLVVEVYTESWNQKCDNLFELIKKEYPSVSKKIYRRGEIIYKSGSNATNVFLLVEGEGRIISTSSYGNASTLFTNNAPIELGLLETLVGRKEYSASFIAASENCTVVKIPNTLFVEAIQSSLPAMSSIIRSQAKAMDYNLNQNVRKNFISKKDQLILYLYECSALYSLPYIIPNDRASLSNILGINLRTLFRYTDALFDSGFLSKAHGKLVITKENQEKLCQAVPNIYEKM